MRLEIKKLLRDIADACRNIEGATRDADPVIVWQTVRESVPDLRRAAERLLLLG